MRALPLQMYLLDGSTVGYAHVERLSGVGISLCCTIRCPCVTLCRRGIFCDSRSVCVCVCVCLSVCLFQAAVLSKQPHKSRRFSPCGLSYTACKEIMVLPKCQKEVPLFFEIPSKIGGTFFWNLVPNSGLRNNFAKALH